MEGKDRLGLLEQHLALAEAVARAVAYGSPSPVEEYRASINGEVLSLRAEQDVPEHEEGSVEDQQDDLVQAQVDAAAQADEPVTEEAVADAHDPETAAADQEAEDAALDSGAVDGQEEQLQAPEQALPEPPAPEDGGGQVIVDDEVHEAPADAPVPEDHVEAPVVVDAPEEKHEDA